MTLYNALTGKSYAPDTEVVMETLSDVLYMNQRNDVAFLMDGRLIVLIEHQSTINDNMAVRFLLYMARVFEKMSDTTAMYRKKGIPLPKPEFIVLYNGEEDFPEEQEQRLSDLFIGLLPDERPTLELIVKIININYGKSKEILKRDKTLQDYSYFIYLVRQYKKQGFALGESIQKAISNCIQQDILKDFLKQNGSEVDNMLLAEWNMEDYARVRAEEAAEEAAEKAAEKTRKEDARNLLREGIPLESIQRALELDAQTLRSLQDQP